MSEPPTGGGSLEAWGMVRQAWRLAPLLTPRRADLLLRWRSAAGLPLSRGRFAAMGLADETVAETLRRVCSLADWDVAWTWAAQRFLGESRRQSGLGNEAATALARRHAALAFHVALFYADEEPRRRRALRAAATGLFAQSIPSLRPVLERVDVVWRTARLPGLLARPATATGAVPLVVLLNGASTAKEETILWSGRFLDHGLAVLALDWPGTGEAAQTMPLTADCDDLTDGVLSLAAADGRLDAGRVALAGVSLGGALAAGAAAGDRRIAAAVAVTPPFDATRWLTAASPLLWRHLGGEGVSAGAVHGLADAFALRGIGQRLRVPLLVFGGGRDLVVPPPESVRLAAAAGELATLVWFPRGGHALYDELPDWTEDAARWLSIVLGG